MTKKSSDLNVMTQAEFARAKGVSKKTVTKWKEVGRVVMVGDKIDVAASEKKLVATQRPNYARAKTDIAPAARRIVDEIEDPAKRATVETAISIAYVMPAFAALSAIDSGATLKLAHGIFDRMATAVAGWLSEELAAMDCPPFSTESDPAVWNSAELTQPNWPKIAAERGEPFTPDLWRAERCTTAEHR